MRSMSNTLYIYIHSKIKKTKEFIVAESNTINYVLITFQKKFETEVQSNPNIYITVHRHRDRENEVA